MMLQYFRERAIICVVVYIVTNREVKISRERERQRNLVVSLHFCRTQEVVKSALKKLFPVLVVIVVVKT